MAKKNTKKSQSPKVDAVSGAARKVTNKKAYNYNQFFGPIQDRMEVLAAKGKENKNSRAKLAGVASTMSLGNYTEEPSLYGLKDIEELPINKQSGQTQDFINSLSDEQIDALTKSKNKGLRLARDMRLKPNQLVPAMRANRYMEDVGLTLFRGGGYIPILPRQYAMGGPLNPYINFEDNPININASQTDTLVPMEQNNIQGTNTGGFNPTTELFDQVADTGSGIIDTFATEDKIVGGEARVNKGASAGKGALKGAASGAAIGSVVPIVGTAIGAGIGAIGGAISGFFGGKKKEEEMQEKYDENKANYMSKVRLSQMKPQPGYLPVAEAGGFLTYKGQTHEGPDGGIPVDASGSPANVTNKQPIALTEKDEVVWFNPETQSPYIFSEKSGFAGTAKKYINKYKLDKDDRLTKNDKLMDDTVNKLFSNLMAAQELYNEKNPSKTKPPQRVMQRGGGLDDDLMGPPQEIPLRYSNFQGGQRNYPMQSAQNPQEFYGVEQALPYVFPNAPVSSQPNTHRMETSVPSAPSAPNTRTASNNGFTNSQMGAMMGIPYGELAPEAYMGFDDVTPANSRFNMKMMPSDLSPWGGSQERWYNESYLPHMRGNESWATVGGDPILITDSRVGREHEYMYPLGMEMQNIASFNNLPNELSKITETRENIMKAPTKAKNDAYDPRLSPLGHILSGVGALGDYASYKRNRPENVGLGRFAPEQVSYALDRANRSLEGADAQRINAMTARNLGTNAGTAMANMAGAQTGVNKLLGQQLSSSFENETNTNADLRTRANQINAQLQSQEAMYNNQMQNMYRQGLVDRNPLSNLSRMAASYFKDDNAYKMRMKGMELDNPNARLTAPKYKTDLGRFLNLKLPNIKYK